jgi:structural maintenance of chromosome 3 (chondroitin sulfate proteoglycan 6)
MTDQRRLDLLKEVAGTNVYDERKAESLTIMDTTNARLEKVNGVIAYINERLEELNEEKDELAEYLSIEKQRRAIQYVQLFLNIVCMTEY